VAWLLLVAAALACPLRRVEPPLPDLRLRGLPRGSIVEVIPGACSSGDAVARLVQLDRLHASPGRLNPYLCLPEDQLRPIVGDVLQQGAVRSPISTCALPGGDYRVLPVHAAAALDQFEAGLLAMGVPYDPAALRVSDAGWVEMPLSRYDAARQAEEFAREGLEGAYGRNKAVVGEGPLGLYTHFQGEDPPGVDLWAAPDFALDLIALSIAWRGRCAATRSERRCALSLGDISWFVPKHPDPLGHKDHDEGRCVDLRLCRVDESRVEAIYTRADSRPGRGKAYDRQMTQEFVDLLFEEFEVRDLFFNDRKVKGPRPWPGHNDHIHLCLEARRAADPVE
jgi:hypothetical protein